MIETSVSIREPFDLDATMRALGVATRDAAGRWWWATRGRAGTGTLSLERTHGSVLVRAWGGASVELVDRAPRLLGLDEEPDLRPVGPAAPYLRDVRGMRLGSTGDVHGALVAAVLGQMVTTAEAKASLRAMVERLGEPAPGPHRRLRLMPSPAVLAGMRHDQLHGYGIERRRASTLIEVSRRSARLAAIDTMDRDAALRRLTAVAGVGVWTAALVMGVAWGDRDAVPIGDYHLPDVVAWALAGEPRGTDERMLDLLEAYRPARRRVLTALKLAGVHAPRYGPRTPLRTHL